MAGHFGSDPLLEVVSVDVVDERVVEDGYEFQLVDDVLLPFDDASFDVVVSNHVIEHVGARDSQLTHLKEIHRVIAPSGVGYLALPNRWALIEPHFRLPFLSWVPESWRSGYLGAFRKGDHYDCRPLGYRELNRMLREAGLGFEHLEVEALRLVGETEDAGILATAASRVPDSLLAAIKPISPTLVCRLFPDSGHSS
jgi:SAM-dependent methyltransferase